MLLISYEISLDLTCSAIFVICIADRETTFAIVYTNLYGPEDLYNLKIMQNDLNNESEVLNKNFISSLKKKFIS